jgi:hypothetical protein
MKKIFIVCFIIFGFSVNSFAQSFSQWIPLDQLVKESDLIVRGTLRSVSHYTNDNTDYSEGVIVIEEVVSGSVKTTEDSPLKSGDRIKLTWQNPSTKIHGRIELGGSEDNEVIWILRAKSDGNVTADNLFSIRAATTNQLGEIRKILRKQRTRKDLQTVKLFDEICPSITNPNQQTQNSDTNQNHVIEVNIKSSQNSSLAVLITILFSLSLYWILYRSRFKIR